MNGQAYLKYEVGNSTDNTIESQKLTFARGNGEAPQSRFMHVPTWYRRGLDTNT